jgi:hypothetical protein
MIGMQNPDYWAQTEFDEGVRRYNQDFAEDQRRYDQDFAEEQRQYNESMAFNKEQAELDEAYRRDTFEEQKRQNEADNKYRDRAMSQSVYEFAVTHGDKDGNGVLTPDEIAEYNAVEEKKALEEELSLTNTEISALEEAYISAGGGDAGYNAVLSKLEAFGKGELNDRMREAISNILDAASNNYFLDWTIDKDTFNGGGGDDNNDVYKKGDQTMTFKELKKKIEASGLSDKEKETAIKRLKNMSKK